MNLCSKRNKLGLDNVFDGDTLGMRKQRKNERRECVKSRSCMEFDSLESGIGGRWRRKGKRASDKMRKEK